MGRAYKRSEQRFFVEEGWRDDEDEMMALNDELFDQYMTEAFLDDEDDEALEMPPINLDELFLAFNGNHEYFMDGNGPGVVYYCRHGQVNTCMRTLISEGGNPFELDRDGALSLVTDGDTVFGRWYFRKCPDWWYEGPRDYEQ
jgi:hypothetical protein